MTHKIALTNASALLLVSILSAEGWASSIPDIVQAGSLLTETFKNFEMKNVNGKADKEWVWQTAEWELTEKQRECCKRAVCAMIAAKKVPTGRPSFDLVKAFGLE